jgi:hypothetical protein
MFFNNIYISLLLACVYFGKVGDVAGASGKLFTVERDDLYRGESGKLAGVFLLEFRDILRLGSDLFGILDRGLNFGTSPASTWRLASLCSSSSDVVSGNGNAANSGIKSTATTEPFLRFDKIHILAEGQSEDDPANLHTCYLPYLNTYMYSLTQ